MAMTAAAVAAAALDCCCCWGSIAWISLTDSDVCLSVSSARHGRVHNILFDTSYLSDGIFVTDRPFAKSRPIGFQRTSRRRRHCDAIVVNAIKLF